MNRSFLMRRHDERVVYTCMHIVGDGFHTIPKSPRLGVLIKFFTMMRRKSRAVRLCALKKFRVRFRGPRGIKIPKI